MAVLTPIPGSDPVDADALLRRHTLLGRTLNFCRRKPLGAIGLAIVLVFAVAGAFAEFIAPFDPEENDFNAMMIAPGLAHLLGTDQFGRDIFSRLVFGARTAMIVGFGAAVGGGLIGMVLGVTSAYFGGWFDLVLQRIFDILMAFPLIILALAVVSVFGTGVVNVVIAITIPLVPRCGRVVRASALAVREVPFVDAARALGFGHARIVLRHMVPNVLAPFLILLSAFVGQAILAEASLSFLGLGVQEPVAAWGLMLQGSAEEYATTAPWIAIFPGLAIVFTVLGASLFGDALRDAIDPKLRDR
jgi:peptide/nickel transport system permease protein